VVCWNTKAAICLKRVKIEETLLWKAYRNSPTLFGTVPSPTAYGLLFPKIGGSQPHPKLQSLLSQEKVKPRTSNLTGTHIIHRIDGNKVPLKISGKVDVGVLSDSKIYFKGTPGRIARSSLR